MADFDADFKVTTAALKRMRENPGDASAMIAAADALEELARRLHEHMSAARQRPDADNRLGRQFR